MKTSANQILEPATPIQTETGSTNKQVVGGKAPAPAAHIQDFPGVRVFYARPYVSPRTRPLSPDERETRAIAYGLKGPDLLSTHLAAREMAALLPDVPCVLVPIPESNGEIFANVMLCREIQRHAPQARIIPAIIRKRAVESSMALSKAGKRRLKPHEHHFIKAQYIPRRWLVYFVDNVTTSGSTLTAAKRALGFGAGLVWANANTPENHAQEANQ